MNNNEYEKFMSKNAWKISKYVNSLDIISKDIDFDDYSKAMDDLISINPKINEFGTVHAYGIRLSRLIGSHWSTNVEWNEFLSKFENEISEVVDYFKNLFPISFLKLNHFQYR